MSETFSIYFAGDLFNHKDLVGNLLLSEAIEKNSSGRYICILPQHLEQSTSRSVEIRNNDLMQIVKADLILLNFDGTELDSGTVIEFLFAKVLDVPAVILRTDFRSAGDQKRGDPWNLMCSGYPRTRTVSLNAMAWYQEAWNKGGETHDILKRFYRKLSKTVTAEFDLVLKEPSLFENDEIISNVFEWALRFPGSDLIDFLEKDELKKLLLEKQKKGIF